WAELDGLRREVAAGLVELGLSAGERVNILSNSRYEWMASDLGVLTAGGTTVPIYQSLLPDEASYIIQDCGAVYIFAEDSTQVAKLVEKKAEIGNVRKVIVFDGPTDDEWLMSFEALVELGRAKLEMHADALRLRSDALDESSVLTLIYTSGTTGRPKGVVLTHGNMFGVCEASLKIDLIRPDDLQLLFLPMAHVFAKLLECTWFMSGHEMAIDSDIQRITQNLGEVKPTLMASVPRIFEKVFARVVGAGLEAPGLRGRLFKWAMGLNDQYAQLRLEGKPIPFGLDLQLGLAKRLVFSKVNERLQTIFGGRIKFFISGGAPLPKKMAFFFENAGVKILEGYGLTETSAATCVNRPDHYKIGSVGMPLPGTELKIAEDGEILIRGSGVMREYWNRPDATQEVLLEDGWFASGDIGVIDGDGFLTITDRKKDIIVTAGGKNVAPQNIENAVKSANPLISQVMVHGDKRKYLVALITLEPEAAAKLGEEKGVGSDYAAVCRSDAARAAVQTTLDSVNSNLARYETIKSFRILEKDFEVGEELTPTLKVKRKLCNQKFADILDAFYDEQVA
ncbi:MAG: long-chain fatty acid--CoA ligase, partial [Myxococcota bacterium]